MQGCSLHGAPCPSTGDCPPGDEPEARRRPGVCRSVMEGEACSSQEQLIQAQTVFLSFSTSVSKAESSLYWTSRFWSVTWESKIILLSVAEIKIIMEACSIAHGPPSRVVCVFRLWPLWTVALQAPWDSPTGVGCRLFLQGIFLTQGSNSRLLCLLQCRRVLYPLSPTENQHPLNTLCYFTVIIDY